MPQGYVFNQLIFLTLSDEVNLIVSVAMAFLEESDASSDVKPGADSTAPLITYRKLVFQNDACSQKKSLPAIHLEF